MPLLPVGGEVIPTFGLYLIHNHPMHHHILISFPSTDTDPRGYCVDCEEVVDVRFIHPGWLDVTELKIDIDGITGVDDDPATTAYAKGMIRSINSAIENYQKTRAARVIADEKAARAAARASMKRRTFLKHVDFVITAIKLHGRPSTKQIFNKYREIASDNGVKKLRCYRAVHYMLDYLVDKGEVIVEKASFGRGGVKNFYQMREDNGKGTHQADVET